MLQTNLLNPGHADLVTRELHAISRFGVQVADKADVVYDFYGEKCKLTIDLEEIQELIGQWLHVPPTRRSRSFERAQRASGS